MRFQIVCVGRNCVREALPCLESIAAQVDVEFRVAVVDDASDDGTQFVVSGFARSQADDQQWWVWSTDVRRGAMWNQWTAWQTLGADADADDVFVWVDLDDRLADDHALARVADWYRRTDALVTYGQYRSEPHSATCQPARAYPREVLDKRAFRQWIRAGGGIWHNHLRTMRWSVLEQIDEADCKDNAGRWWMSGPDMAVMLPALEIAGPRAWFIPDVTYVYTSDRDDSEWRKIPDLVHSNHQEMLARPPKVPAGVLERPTSVPVRRPRQVPTRAVTNRPRR